MSLEQPYKKIMDDVMKKREDDLTELQKRISDAYLFGIYDGMQIVKKSSEMSDSEIPEDYVPH